MDEDGLEENRWVEGKVKSHSEGISVTLTGTLRDRHASRMIVADSKLLRSVALTSRVSVTQASDIVGSESRIRIILSCVVSSNRV